MNLWLHKTFGYFVCGILAAIIFSVSTSMLLHSYALNAEDVYRPAIKEVLW
jgi:hypothetical protein